MPESISEAFDRAGERLDRAFGMFWTSETPATIDELSIAASIAAQVSAAVIAFTIEKRHRGDDVDLTAARHARTVLKKSGLGLHLVAWKRAELQRTMHAIDCNSSENGER